LIRSTEIMDDMIPQVISDEFYFPDGQIREEDYEYGSFLQSKMFNNNVRCSDCHNPHSGKLKLIDNALCLSCHEPKYNTKEHHFHTINTEGAKCISCHMSTKTFMGNDVRRDHSFRIPRPDQSIVYGTPNTCTSCHTKQSASWAADAINKWYGPKRAPHFSDDLLPGSLLTDKSEQHLVKLLADTLQPGIARATAAHYLSSIQTTKSVNALLLALRDKQAMVRYYSLRSLEDFPSDLWIQSAHTALRDKVGAVRIAAADLYHSVPPEAIPVAARNAYQQADAENRKYLNYQTDFAAGNVMLADYELQGGDHLNAIVHYVRGLKKDSLMNYARLNLSAAYNNVNKNPEALKELNDAAKIDASNDRIFFNLGLLHYELGDVPAAMENFEKANHLGSQNPGLYYNYGLLLQQQKRNKEAETILLKGYAISPQAVNINYALAYLYVSQNNPQKARPHAMVLQAADPNNPDYQPLFRSLGF
jgi:tetratricopeptide (TPR) repeat protein